MAGGTGAFLTSATLVWRGIGTGGGGSGAGTRRRKPVVGRGEAGDQLWLPFVELLHSWPWQIFTETAQPRPKGLFLVDRHWANRREGGEIRRRGRARKRRSCRIELISRRQQISLVVSPRSRGGVRVFGGGLWISKQCSHGWSTGRRARIHCAGEAGCQREEVP